MQLHPCEFESYDKATRFWPEEEDKLADMASAVVIKDQGFVSRVRSHLATLFPSAPRESEVQPTAD